MSGFLCRPKSKMQKKGLPKNESPLPWHPGHVGLASMPPPYLSPGKSIVPLGSPTSMGLRELLKTAPYNKVIFFNSLGSFFTSQRKFLIFLYYFSF